MKILNALNAMFGEAFLLGMRSVDLDALFRTW
jgi:hypothetical protein